MNLCGIYDDEKLEVLNMNLNLAKEFHEKFTRKLIIFLNNVQLLNFRKNILITLLNNVNSLFKDDRIIQMYYNTLHSICTLSQKYDFTIDMEDEKFRYFFYAGLFLVSKFENNDYFRCFHQKAIKENMNLNGLYEIEKTILEEIRKVYYFSPDEISKTIIEGLKEYIDSDKIDKISESFNVFIYYALSEFDIYVRYDQFLLSLACLYIAFKNEDTALIKEFENILQNLNVNKFELMQCINYIETQLNCTKEEEEAEVVSTKTCSSSSTSSACKENIRRRTAIKRRNSHNKINKLVTVKESGNKHMKCQGSIHYYFKYKKTRPTARQKSI